MRLTNIYNLPQAIVDAVKNDSYNKGNCDYSVTQLLKPARVLALERKHDADLVEDAADRIWSMQGQAMHVIAERANRTAIAERRLTMVINGIKISGGMDLYLENKTLIDYKNTTVGKFKYGTPKEYVRQLNIYAEILRSNEEAVEHLQIIALLRDWIKKQAKTDPHYPQVQIKTLSIPVWKDGKARELIQSRVTAHEEAKVTLPLCSNDERWMRRDGTFARCEDWCIVNSFCEQYQGNRKGDEMAIQKQQGSGGGFINEPGEYRAHITETVMTTTKATKKPMRVVTFRTEDEKEIKAYFVKDVVFATKAMESLKVACGLSPKDHPESLVGKQCGLLVEPGRPTEDGKVFMQIVGYGKVDDVGQQEKDFADSPDVPF